MLLEVLIMFPFRFLLRIELGSPFDYNMGLNLSVFHFFFYQGGLIWALFLEKPAARIRFGLLCVSACADQALKFLHFLFSSLLS